MVIYVPTTLGGSPSVARSLRACQADYDGPVTLLSVFMQAEGAGDLLAGGPDRRSIPTYTFPEAAALALFRAVRHGEWRQREIGVDLDLDEATTTAIREV